MFSPSPYTPVPAYQGKYVSTHKRAQIVRLLLMIGAALSMVSLLFATLHFLAPSTILTDDSEEPIAIILALMEGGAALMELAVYVATIVFFLMWLYRSFENLPALGVPPRSIEYSSGWAVGSFFIPFLSLVIPYRAIRELWNKSIPNSGTMFGSQSPPWFFPVWWAAWLLSNFASNIYLRMSFSDRLSPGLDATIGAVSAALSIVAALFAMKVVDEIDKQQMESSKQMPYQVASQAPPLPELVLNDAPQPQPGS